MADEDTRRLFSGLNHAIEFTRQAIQQVAELKTEVSNLVIDDSTLKDIEELGSKDVTIRHYASDLEVEFIMAASLGNAFISRVEDVVKHCSEDEIETIKGEVKKYKFNCVANFLMGLKAKMADCEETYQTFNKHCVNIQRDATTIAVECNRQAELADCRRTRTQAGGGAAAATLLAAGVGGGLVAGAGVAASVVAGVFTFGVGTAVGLTITGIAATGTGIAIAGGAGAAGVATAVATGVIASKYHKVAKALRQIKQAFDKLHHAVCSLLKILNQLKVEVDGLDYTVKYLEEANRKEQKDAVSKNLHKIHRETVCLQTIASKQHIQQEQDRLREFIPVY